MHDKRRKYIIREDWRRGGEGIKRGGRRETKEKRGRRRGA